MSIKDSDSYEVLQARVAKLEEALRHARERIKWENHFFPVAEDLTVFAAEITEPKHAEQWLSENEMLARDPDGHLRAILDAAPIIIWTAYDKNCRTILGNRIARELFRVDDEKANMSRTGLQPERHADMRFYKDGKELAPDEMPLRVAARTGQEFRHYAVELVLDDGAEYSLFGNVVPVFDSEGNPSGAVAAFIDISQRKRAEELLRESEERYRSLFSSSLDAVLLTEPDCRIFAANDAACRMFGFTEQELLGAGRSYIVDASDPRLAIALEIHRRTGKFCGELTYLRKDGTKFFGETSSAVYTDLHGERRASNIIRDIAKRKLAEEALRKSEARLSLATNQAGMGTWDANWLTGKSVWSESFFRLLGYEPHPDGEATVEMWRARIHPEDRVRVSQECERARVDRNSGYVREYRVIRADTNEVVWLSGFARFLYDENGVAVRHIGIVFDSTWRKRMEEELRKSNNELDLTIQALNEKTQNLEEVNAAMKVLLRQREEDKKELGESVVANVRNLILPYTEKLKQSQLSSAQMTWMKILESHINEIISSFSRTLSAQYANLTSTEIRIATFVRDGRSTAQIAELLSISEKTVCRHRDNIRKKLGLRGLGINLRTYLLSLQ